VGTELSVRQTREGVEISAPLRRGGTGPALIAVERRGGEEACRMDAPSAASSTPGRVTCSLSLADARRAGGADVPLSILIVPAT
jgi:hypothetical protein